MTSITITPLHGTPDELRMLNGILIETVANGGSVSFLHPLAPEAASSFWARSAACARRGERVILGAWQHRLLVGTVTLLLDLPPNQPHRAEIAKLMTLPSHRGRGVATALMQAAEAHAIAHGRTLLVLDTAVDGGAAGLYDRLGYRCIGQIPDYALKPHGGLTGTWFYWKRIGAA